MKNVTIALDDETHRQARIRAAELGTSLSALVKDYLTRLVAEDAPTPEGVRDMTMPFAHAPAAKADGPPWLVDGKWVYTKDGKPRQPGSLREKLKDLSDDWDTWSPEMEAFFEKLQDEPWDDNPPDQLEFDESQLPKK
jgi:plasmid stability protein